MPLAKFDSIAIDGPPVAKLVARFLSPDSTLRSCFARPSNLLVSSTPPSSLNVRFKAPSCPDASSVNFAVMRSSWNSPIVRHFGFSLHYLRELDCPVHVTSNVTQRH